MVRHLGRLIRLNSESESCSVVSNSLWPHGLCSPWNSLGQNTGVDSLCFLQGIFLTLGLNPGLPYCRQILYYLSQKESPSILEWLAYPFSSRSSWPRNRTRVSCIGRQILYQLNYQGSPKKQMGLYHTKRFYAARKQLTKWKCSLLNGRRYWQIISLRSC